MFCAVVGRESGKAAATAEKKDDDSFATQLLATTLSVLCSVITVPLQVAAQSPQPGYSGQHVPLTAEEILPLVAPIALYPDAPVAQVLAAATFPDQVAAAEGCSFSTTAI